MMILKSILFAFAICLVNANGFGAVQNPMKSEETMTPQHLFKIISVENWRASEGKKTVQLSQNDEKFIHFATKDQLNDIIVKYWSGVPKYVVLKIDAAKLPGKLVFEKNPGGTNKYYHLYKGSIPMDAVVIFETRLGH
jgi:uncharacterized protein (DUF952 family)